MRYNGGMVEKTLAMKVLEGRKIPYELVTYPETERDAAQLAELFGAPAGQVFKTLVVARPGKKPLLVLTPADRQLDLKKLARVAGDKKLHMATHAQAEQLTGLQVGGISPLALLNKGFVIYVDQSVAAYPHIYLSAGRRGVNLKVPTPAVLQLLQARTADLT